MPDTPSRSAVAADRLIKQFGRVAALRGVSGEFDRGRLYVIVGDNGAGKTTLLRILAGLSQPTRGHISILGTSKLKVAQAQIGYMAHASLLYDDMNGIENLRYFAGLYGIDQSRCRQVIVSVRLDPDLARPVSQYSQGMRQRMSLARALLNDPQLLLLDEPFSNVDAHSASEMAGLLGQLRDQGRTLFVVTHQPALMEWSADEFVLMEMGRIVNRTPFLRAVAP